MFGQTSIHVCRNCTHHVTMHQMIPITEVMRRDIYSRHIRTRCTVFGCGCIDYQEVTD